MERRYVVLGFRNRDGSLGFGLTSNPLGYLIKNHTGEFVSAAVHAAADLVWAIAQPSHEHAAALRDQLNELKYGEAGVLAADQSIEPFAIQRLKALASQAVPAYRRRAVIELDDIALAWELIPAFVLPSLAPRPAPELDLDDPFEPLPRIWPPRPPVDWAGVDHLAADLFIFDLDGTLVDTSAVEHAREIARRTRDWRPVRDMLDQVGAFPAWGRVAPQGLPGVLRQHGYRVGVLSRAPRSYVEGIIEHFALEADEIVWACGQNKITAFESAIGRAGTKPERTWVFGDDASDFRAADWLGCWHLGNPWACTGMSPRVAPDIAWFDAETLLAERHWLDLRYVGEQDDPSGASWHRGSLLCFGEDAVALGRYFKAGKDRHYDPLSVAVLDAKHTTRPHPLVASALDLALTRLGTRAEIDLVVTIPPRAGALDRFENYRRRSCVALDATDQVDVRIAHEVPPGYRRLSRADKLALRAGRYACHDDLSGQTVLVLDDVTTTGATMGAMRDALYEAGAARVIQLAWAVTQD